MRLRSPATLTGIGLLVALLLILGISVAPASELSRASVGGSGNRTAVAAPIGTPLRFTASGDISSNAAAQSVLSAIGTINPDLHLALGDLSYGTTGNEQAWCDLVTARVGNGFPFELIAGNHESNGLNGNINDFSACLPNQLPGLVGTYGRQYYVDVPAVTPLVRYIMISPNITFPDSTWSYAAGTPRLAWTAQAIDGAAASSIPWVVVGMHKPCLSVGEYACDSGPALMNMLLDKRVDLVLTGHEHLYQRTHQIATRAGCATVVPGTYSPDCIVDGDSTMVAGAGTVFATIGTGGVTLRNVDSTDPDYPWMAATSGLNSDPTYGSLDVTLTPTTLSASFARASGGTFTDSFTLTPSTGNEAPTARFTASCAGLDCSADGSASGDTDGTVAGYAWIFGDGATATGVTTSHAYADSGSYTIGLTVTDNAGATSTTTRTVTATVPPPPGSLAVDDFARAVSAGWGSAPAGGVWSLTGSLSHFSVGAGTGNIRLPAGAAGSVYLAGVQSTTADVRATASIDKLVVGGSAFISAIARRVPSVGAYQAKVVVVAASGRVTLGLVRVNASGGGEVAVRPAVVVPGLTAAGGTPLAVRVRTVGTNPTTLEARLWPAGTAEPTTWTVSGTDATVGLQAAGGVGFTGYVSGGTTNAPVTISIDDLAVGQ